MIRARMFAIACGYEDCDDLDVLRFDPAFKLACGRLPESGRDLMSQPTLSRLEPPAWRGLTMDLFCDSFERVPNASCSTLTIPLMPSTAASNWRFNDYDEYCAHPHLRRGDRQAGAVAAASGQAAIR